MTSEIIETPFPAAALIPKAETNVLSFMQKYPEFDGRDVTIAIFDSGVDPRAAGLQTLCDGKTVKVIERYDCSGCGDVDTQKKVTADANGQIIGQSGRTLKLTKQMLESNIAKGEFRIGLKIARDICPCKVRECQMSRMKIKQWDSAHKTAVADLVRKINEFELENPDAKTYSWEKKLFKENLDSKLDLLNNYEKIYNDIEISYDCVLYQTKNGWQAVIDTTEKGDLENAVHIGEYSLTHEVKNLDDFVSISMNVHDNGDVLEIVNMCSAHGTHVASIASSNKACSDVDGIAPNAKIVSLTIGDGRLGSMETGSSLIRAMIKVMELCRSGRKVDVINMSYGEHSHWSNSGRIGELMSEVVNKYGVVWVVSAGNSGPALSSVGTPPDIGQTSLIGVGAYVSPQMMEAEYAMREKLPGNVYSWTSRDPCLDGGRGVTICAPGGAIASVPQFTMAKSQLMNGTSMAAPHVAGAIALLISGLKQSGVEYTPFSIKRALSATATYLNHVDPFAQGHGLLNVEKAFEHLIKFKHEPDNMLRYSARLTPGGAKGIHIRDGIQKPQEFTVAIEPKYFNELEAAAEKKYNFNVRLNLICTESFVQCGAFLDLNYASRNLAVKVDPSGLAPGAHAAFIRAYDTNCVQKGPLFEIPITVIQPHVLNGKEMRTFEPPMNDNGSILFQPNTIKRHFIMVPSNASWAVLRMQSTDKNVNGDVGKFFVHTMQLLPKKSSRCLEGLKTITVTGEIENTITFKVEENNILELCIAKHWANFGNINIKYKLDFHGVKAINPSANIMHAARGIHRVELNSFILEEVQPQFQLKNAVVVLRPSESKISPLSATRDVVPEGRQIYQNVLTYNFSLSKAAEIALQAPVFNNILYEGEFESNLWLMFDSGKSLVASGDSFTEKSFRKLEKGDYFIRLQVRHEKRENLEKISETNMLATIRLASTYNFDNYDHYNQCLIGGRKVNSCIVRENKIQVFYVAPLTQEKLSKLSLPNNTAWLSGTMSFAKDENGKRIDWQEFTYVLNPTAEATKKSTCNNNKQQQLAIVQQSTTTTTATTTVGDGVPVNNNSTVEPVATDVSPKKGKTEDDYIEALRDFQCSMIIKCDLEKAESIYQEVLAAHPRHLPAHMNLIQNLESSQPKAQYPFTFEKIATSSLANQEEIDINKTKVLMKRIADLAENVIKGTDVDALLAFYGMKTDTRPDAAKIKTANDKQRTNLLEALAKRGIALCKYYMLEKTLKDHVEELDNIYLDILKFVDITDSKVLLFGLWHAYAREHYGRMYKLLQKLQEDKRCREIYEELYLVTKAMEYAHLSPVVRRRAIAAYPGSYRNF